SFSSRAAELSSLISSSPFWSVATIYVLIADMCMIFSNLLYRHVHDGLVGIDHLVAHLYRCLEGDRGFLAGDHHIGQIDGLVAHIETGAQIIGGALQFVDVAERLLQQLTKVRGDLTTGLSQRRGASFNLESLHLLHQAACTNFHISSPDKSLTLASNKQLECQCVASYQYQEMTAK